jgi:hypothetical protein
MTEEHPAHSELPPSSADKWFHCHAWRRLTHGVEDTSSAAAEEGTIAHEWLAGHLMAEKDLVDCDDPEMSDHLFMCVEWVNAQAGDLYVETRVDYGEAFGFADLTGTSDLIFVADDHLTIADLKNGRVFVEVGEAQVFASNEDDDSPAPVKATNLQMLCYLVGAVQKFGPRPKYRLAILQPRSWHRDGPIRDAWLTHEELEAFKVKLGAAIKASYNPKAEACAGPWCRHYCKALSRCRTAAKLSLDLFRDNPVE